MVTPCIMSTHDQLSDALHNPVSGFKLSTKNLSVFELQINTARTGKGRHSISLNATPIITTMHVE